MLHDYKYTSSTHIITTTPTPITLTGPGAITNQLITSVTCETTSISIITRHYSTRTTIHCPYIGWIVTQNF